MSRMFFFANLIETSCAASIQMTVHGMWAARLVQSHMIVMLRPSMRTKMNTACMLFWAPLQMRDVGGLSPEPHQA